MTYTIEDVKRLVPEATEFYSNGVEVIFTIGHITHGSDSAWGKALLTTRRKLEIALEGLEDSRAKMSMAYDAVSNGLYNESLLHIGIGVAHAEKALDAIKKEGEA